jgi:hypothetical protein
MAIIYAVIGLVVGLNETPCPPRPGSEQGQTAQLPSAHDSSPPAGTGAGRGCARAHAVSSASRSTVAGWAPDTPYRVSMTKSGTAVMP